jgi:sugar lactone lactonase YvrE
VHVAAVFRAAFVSLFLVASAAPSMAEERPIGSSEVFAATPSPGFPEGIAVRGNRVYVAGPATFGLNTVPAVLAYDLKTKALVATYPITIANPYAQQRALSCIAFGPDGKLYVIEPFVGVIRMDLNAANTQEVYAPFPAPPATGALPNDLAFDGTGNLFVTDSFQGLIYRIPAGGGAPAVWFQDPRLLANPALPFGVNGIRIDKKAATMYVTVTVRADLSGAVLRLPLVDAPTAGDLSEFHVFGFSPVTGVPGPDGIALAKNGRLYVALAGTSQVAVLSPEGQEIARFNGPAQGPNGSTLPWANPANIAFNDLAGTILVTNHASLVPYDPALFGVFDVKVEDKGVSLP